MDLPAVFLLALAFFAFGLAARAIDRLPLTGPMLFTALGLLLGPLGLAVLEVEVEHEALQLLAEITLVVVLFSDAASIDLRKLERGRSLPFRLLGFGLPFTVLLGTAAALLLFPSFDLFQAALLAAILAPTDAALGQAVVSNPAVPVRIRQALNVESGLNDGIALPAVLLFAGFASMRDDTGDLAYWVQFVTLQLTIGPAVGAAVGFGCARLVVSVQRRGWLRDETEGLLALGTAYMAFAGAESLSGNGFIAAFVGGLVFGNTLQHRCRFLWSFAETEGLGLVLLTFFAVGLALVPEAVAALFEAPVAIATFAILALTVLRMLPVYLSLGGTGVSLVTSLFLGWFGPRGLASVLFLLVVVETLPAGGTHLLFATVVVTVLLSVLLHGVSARPAAIRYGRYAAQRGDCAENTAVVPMGLRDPDARSPEGADGP